MSSPHEKTPVSPIGSPARDLYEVLSVPHKASSREIRRAYRELARKYHPDFNPGDETAAKKFREVQEAYEILGDAKKRRAYDYYGADFGDRIPQRAPDLARQPGVASPTPSTATPWPRPAARSGWQDFASAYRHRSAVGLPRLVSAARLIFVTVPLVFVVGSLLYIAWPDAGVKEFQRTQEALKYVSSWKVQGKVSNSEGSVAGEYLVEVSCPASQHTTQHIQTTALGLLRDFTLETIAIGNHEYTRNLWAGRWTHGFTSPVAATGPCAYLQRSEDAAGLPPFHQWLNGSFVIEKKNLRQTPDGKCREWKIVIPRGFSGGSNWDFVCLGVNDHLPRFHGAPGSVAEERFYDWNVPNEIVAPPLGDSR